MNRIQARSELRGILDDIARLNKPALRLTSLGMHYVAIDDQPVLVLVEMNVPRLLAVSVQRLKASKCGVASLGKGAVRVSIATPEGLEICAASQRRKEK